ncbi:hypothetical protein F5Y15DRAFT_314473 [Xylariaceae sp. FL0016]|nr:hypothetical protein F5Y15DRAFT_314473 [Xylariaceae sp. FL0016]
MVLSQDFAKAILGDSGLNRGFGIDTKLGFQSFAMRAAGLCIIALFHGFRRIVGICDGAAEDSTDHCGEFGRIAAAMRVHVLIMLGHVLIMLGHIWYGRWKSGSGSDGGNAVEERKLWRMADGTAEGTTYIFTHCARWVACISHEAQVHVQ